MYIYISTDVKHRSNVLWHRRYHEMTKSFFTLSEKLFSLPTRLGCIIWALVDVSIRGSVDRHACIQHLRLDGLPDLFQLVKHLKTHTRARPKQARHHSSKHISQNPCCSNLSSLPVWKN